MKARFSAGSVVAVLASLYAGLFTFLSFRRHDSFGTWAFDMGNMDQAVWNSLHGRLLAFTNMEGVTTRLAIHVEPTLILISPIYLLWTDPRALLLLQSVALATGAFPVFWLARRELESQWAAVIVSASYLLFPSLEAVNMAEFHAVALATPLLLWTFCFAASGRWVLYVITSLLAMGTKEEMGLVVALMGIYLAVARRSPLPGLVALAGILWSLTALLVIIPTFNPERSSPYAGYYHYLGDDLVEVAVNLVTHPWIPVQRALSEPGYLESLLMPSGYLALLSPERLALGLPSLLINLLSDNGEMRRPNLYHYTAPLLPAMLLATIAGARRAAVLLTRLGLTYGRALVLAMALLLISTAFCHRREGLTPLASGFFLPPITEHDKVGHEVLQAVPKGVSLSVQSELNAHLSQREKLYVFPRVEDAEYVLVDRLRDPASGDPVNDPSELHRYRLPALEELLQGGEFDTVLDRDGYVILKRKG